MLPSFSKKGYNTSFEPNEDEPYNDICVFTPIDWDGEVIRMTRLEWYKQSWLSKLRKMIEQENL